MSHTILFIKINPIGTSNLFLDSEIKIIEDVLQKSAYRDEYTIISKGAVTIDDLHEYLETYKPQVLHISGHGGNGSLFFHDKENYKKNVSVQQFCMFVKNYTEHLECVFLNACYSLAEIKDISPSYAPILIGMKEEVANTTAILFSKAFYTSFFSGKPVSKSFDSAMGVVGIDGFGDERIPVIMGNTSTTHIKSNQSIEEPQNGSPKMSIKKISRTTWSSDLTILRNTLANLYVDNEDIKRILDESAIDISSIAFSNKPVNTWHGILKYLYKRAEFDNFLEVISVENPEIQSKYIDN
ncbi:CHAT domain-containing protein [Flavivirga algicola]|uniref:CHAT domain-containing protein n=1 Tax=Flavivirga algicola TaxID=2729136 RepID=A0ABX1S122_9FLAO|nr:hypothetical protein [Flavivirga algicola]NMH89579.1 hypothetical protein [Flavivirga algicola]